MQKIKIDSLPLLLRRGQGRHEATLEHTSPLLGRSRFEQEVILQRQKQQRGRTCSTIWG
jgi:hypothetical protein